MDNITITQAIEICSALLVLFALRKEIYNMFTKPKNKLRDRVKQLEQENQTTKKEIADSKVERLILCKGMLACLKGLQEQGCNGPVTQGIKDLEDYLLKSSHD